MVEPGANGTLGVDQLDAAEWWWWPPASLRGWQVWSHWLSAVAGSGANALVAGVIVGHGDLHSARVMYWLCVAVANQLGHVRALLEVLCPPPTPARRLVAQLAGLPTCLLLIVMLIGSVDRLIFTKCEEWHSRRVTARHMLAAQGLSAVLFLVQDGGRFWTLGATAAAKEIVYRERGLFIVLVSTCLIAVKIVLYWHGRWRVAGVVDEISVGSVAAAPEEAQADVESSLRVHRTSARVGDDERRSTLIFLYGLLPLSVYLFFGGGLLLALAFDDADLLDSFGPLVSEAALWHMTTNLLPFIGLSREFRATSRRRYRLLRRRWLAWTGVLN